MYKKGHWAKEGGGEDKKKYVLMFVDAHVKNNVVLRTICNYYLSVY